MQTNESNPAKKQTTEDKTGNAYNYSRRTLWLGLAILLIVTLIGVYSVRWGVKSRQQEIERAIEGRLTLLANGRAEVLSTWLDGLDKQGNRVIQSDLFRLYASEVDVIEADIATLLTASLDPDPEEVSPDIRNLAAQLPMMENLLQEFTRYSGFLSGRIVNRSGQSYIATDANTTPLSATDMHMVNKALMENRTQRSPLHHSSSGLELTVYLPILPPQQGDQQTKPVAVLILSKVVSSKINELLAPSPLAEGGERTRLVQKVDTRYEEIVPWLPGETRQIKAKVAPDEASPIPFQRRSSLEGEKDVFSFGAKVKDIPWWVVHEAHAQTALAPIHDFRRIAVLVVTLVCIAVLLLLGALWWRLVGMQNKKLAGDFKKMAQENERQRRFLDSINANVNEYIGLKDNSGNYRYVNPAFAQAIGRPADEVIGLDDMALFGYDTAKRLESSDHWVIEHRQPTTVAEQIYLQSKLHHLQISKAPFIEEEGHLAGIVSVYRDVTEIVEVQQRSERAVRQTIQALVKTIEETDPYLAGHSRLMSELGLLVAKGLTATEEEIATVETASYLSQIGKVFLPEELLNKTGPLTDEEKKQLEAHVDHAAHILRDIEFELPIFESIYQMNEHLDGSGYPQGLKEDQIIQTARILAVTNSFCAMVKTRAYRPARSVEEALAILQKDANLYDMNVVAQLKATVQSKEGEKLLTRYT